MMHITGTRATAPHKNLDVDATMDATKNVSDVPVAVYFFEATNTGVEDVFLHLYNTKEDDVTVATTEDHTILFVPAGDGTKAGSTEKTLTYPLVFSTALSYIASRERDSTVAQTAPSGTVTLMLRVGPFA